MKNVFNGLITALITPMTDNGIDYDAFRRIAELQVHANVNAIVLFGTTGEPLGLLPEEKTKLFYLAKSICGNKIPIICGISSPITDVAVRSANCFKNLGADGLLVVTPYYYRCLDDGIYLHYKIISDNCDLPIIVYNVPSRTGLDITLNLALFDRISKISSVCAIKNAAVTNSANLAFLDNTSFPTLCGNDEYNLESIKHGGIGSISVISNFLPFTEVALHRFHSDKDKANLAEECLKEVYSTFRLVPNPIAVKYACSLLYGFKPVYRLPLTPPEPKIAELIKNTVYKALKFEEMLF